MEYLKRFWKPAATVLLVGWIAFVAVVNRKMHEGPEAFGHFMSKLPMPAYFVIPFETLWSRARKGQLNPGAEAPDFNLQTYDKTGYVQLSSLRGKPVVLVFGSYT